MLFEDIHSMVKFYALQTPYKSALIQNGEHVSYYQLYEAAKSLAIQLQQMGLKNECVALHLSNSLELVIAYFACLVAGSIAVPLNVNLKNPEIEYIVASTSPKYLMTKNPHSNLVTTLKKITTLNLPEKFNFDFFSSLTTDIHFKLEKTSVSNPALVFYTSGSTAKPKGVTHSQLSLLAMMDNMADCVDLTAQDRFLVSESMSNASGCVHAFLTLYKNATAIIINDFNSKEFKEAVQYKPTIISVMGKGNYDIVHDEKFNKEDFATIKFNFSGGDKITKELMQSFMDKTGIPIRLGYGMSEFLLITINKTSQEDKLTSVGRSTKNITIKLLDSNQMPIRTGNMGEIWVQGPNCMLGYWQNEIVTKETLVNGWLRTGDLAKCDEDGFYWIQGRIKQMIIRDTENISPLEIEDVLATHPAVKTAGVIGIPDPIEGEVPKAFVELKEGQRVEESELLLFVKERLEDFKVPVAIIVVDQLPRTKNGKIAREELKKL